MAIIDGYPATSFDKKDREWVKAVADETAGEVLPDTTEASAGDVLTVGEDGDAEWATPSGGGGGLLVTFTITVVDGVTYWTADASWNDVKNALNAGGSVTVKYSQHFDDSNLTDEWYYTGAYVLKETPDTPTAENPILYVFFIDKEIPIAEIVMYDPDVNLEISFA